MEENKTERFHMRVTAEQRKKLAYLAWKAKMTESAWVRQAIEESYRSKRK